MSETCASCVFFDPTPIDPSDPTDKIGKCMHLVNRDEDGYCAWVSLDDYYCSHFEKRPDPEEE